MFRTLINDAKSAAASVVARYAVRASVAVPFLVAAGFGTAALTLVLADRYGALAAYSIMAGAFALFGLIAMFAVSVKEQEEEIADAAAENNDTAEVATDAAAQAAVQLPLALLGTLLTSPLGPGAAMGGAKALGRNWPLVAMIVLVAFLFWPEETNEPAKAETSGDDLAAPPPEAEGWQPNGMDRQRAA